MTKKRKAIIIFLFATIIISISCISLQAKRQNIKKLNEKFIKITDNDFLSVIKLNKIYDVYLGSDDAKIDIIEYGSFTCYHCSSFFLDNFDKLKKDYIDTGKVRFIHRSVVGDKLGFDVSKVIKCINGDSSLKMKVINLFYSTQNAWISNSAEESAKKINKILTTSGINTVELKKCTEHDKVSQMILDEQHFISKNLNITSTPTIFVGTIKIKGYIGYEELSEAINIELSQKD